MKKLLFALALTITTIVHAQPFVPHSVTLTWTCPANTTPPPPFTCGIDATGFQVQRATITGGPYTTIGTVTGSQTFTYTDVASSTNILIEGTTYFYVVETTGNGGTLSGFSPQAAATIPFLPPNAPSTLSVTSK
jgi:hypothetical protein